MAELPIARQYLRALPGVDGVDAYRWHVDLHDGSRQLQLEVHLTATERTAIPLSDTALRYGFSRALQNYASRRLTNDDPVLDQVERWETPVVLRLENFPGT